MSTKATVELPDEVFAKTFWAWFLDGGGEDGFVDMLAMNDLITEDNWIELDFVEETRTITFKLER